MRNVERVSLIVTNGSAFSLSVRLKSYGGKVNIQPIEPLSKIQYMQRLTKLFDEIA